MCIYFVIAYFVYTKYRKRRLNFENPVTCEALPGTLPMDVASGVNEASSFTCDENECGMVSVGTSFEDDVLELRESQIPQAGTGLHAVNGISGKEIVGYFGGELVCVGCVKRRKLNRKDRHHALVLCGSTYNDSCEEVLWYLHRTGNHEVDGWMWYINSCTSMTSRKGFNKNCSIESQGFNARNEPVVLIKTDCEIMHFQEILLDYMDLGCK